MLSYWVEIPPRFYCYWTNGAQQKYVKPPADSGVAEVQGKMRIGPEVFVYLRRKQGKKKKKKSLYPQRKKC